MTQKKLAFVFVTGIVKHTIPHKLSKIVREKYRSFSSAFMFSRVFGFTESPIM
jgi:hypothetical protein